MRPFCIATIASILGIIIGLYFKGIVLFACIIIVALITIFTKYKKHLTIFLIFFLTFSIYTYALENNYENICQKYENKQIQIEGIIISKPKEKEYKTTYTVKVTQVQNLETKAIEKNKFNVICNIKSKKQTLNYGDKVIITSTFEKPDSQRNEGGFNYKNYLKIKQTAGIINVKSSDINKIGEEVSIYRLIYKLKEKITEKIYELLPKDEATLLIGLLLGENDEISEDIKQNFRKSSLSHILAISGAHISYILITITTLLTYIKFHKRWSNIVISIFLIFFIILVGDAPSVTRACIMCILNLMANFFFKKADTYQNLAISSFIILLINPYSLLDIGFQLSFAGTIGIVIFANKKSKDNNKKTDNNTINKQNVNTNIILNNVLDYIKQTTKVTLSANIIILPIIIYHFNTLSLTFIISNLLVSLILGVSLTLGMAFLALIFTPIAQLISYLTKPVLQTLIFIANICSKIPFSQILVPTPKIWQIIIYYLIILLILYKSKVKLFLKKYLHISKYKFVYKILITTLILTIISPYILSIFPNNKLTIHFIDVGQGDATLIITPTNKTILIDGGGSKEESFNVGEKTLLPYLLKKGITQIDYMIFSHFDTDHCQGLFTILENLKVKNVIISKQGENSQNFQQFIQIINSKKIQIITVKAGDNIKIDKECKIDIIFPTSQLIQNNILNNNSIVAKLTYQNFSILFTGDIEQIAEQKIIEKYKNTNILKSTILKIAHHRFKNIYK